MAVNESQYYDNLMIKKSVFLEKILESQDDNNIGTLNHTCEKGAL